MRRKWGESLLVIGLGIAVGILAAVLVRFRSSDPSPGETSAQPAAQSGAPAPSGERRSDVPRLLTTGVRSELPQAHPDQPDYNPKAYAGVVPATEIFAREPRRPAWAAPVERYLTDKIGRELPAAIPGVKLKRVECRTASCSVQVERTEAAQAVDGVTIRQTLIVLYSASAGGGDPESDEGLVLFYRGGPWFEGVPADDPQALFAAIEKRRADLLRSLRAKQAQGIPLPYSRINLSALPLQ
jgi:hypothetical protein